MANRDVEKTEELFDEKCFSVVVVPHVIYIILPQDDHRKQAPISWYFIYVWLYLVEKMEEKMEEFACIANMNSWQNNRLLRPTRKKCLKVDKT